MSPDSTNNGTILDEVLLGCHHIASEAVQSWLEGFQRLRCPPYPEAMASPAPAIDAELEAVTAALAAVDPRTKRLLLFGSRARGDARHDSDFDVLVVMPQATLTPQERQQATRSLRAALRPLPLVAVDLVVVGAADAERFAGSRWHVVARALREGRELHVAG